MSAKGEGWKMERTKKGLTIQEFAKLVGVAKTTVSHAFSGKGRVAPETRKKILRLAEEHGYEADFFASRIGENPHPWCDAEELLDAARYALKLLTSPAGSVEPYDLACAVDGLCEVISKADAREDLRRERQGLQGTAGTGKDLRFENLRAIQPGE